MKFKVLLSLIFLSFLGIKVNAQDLDIAWGDEFDSKTEVQKILGFVDNQMVAYSMKGTKRYLETYSDDNFMMKQSNEIELPEIEGKKSGMLNLSVTGKNVTAMLYVYNKREKTFSLYIYTMGINGKAKAKPKRIYQSDEAESREIRQKVSVTYSDDKSKAMVYFARSNKAETEFKTDLIILEMSDEVSEIYSTELVKEMRGSSADRVYFNMKYMVENDGSFSTITDKIEYRKREATEFKIEMTRYNPEGDEIGTVVIEDDDKILGAPAVVRYEDKLVMVGYYTSNPKNRISVPGYSGLFKAEISLDMELTAYTTDKFSDEFFENLYSVKRIEKLNAKGKEIMVPAPYTMNDIVVHGDGSITILSEYFLIVTTTNDKGATTTTTTFGPVLYFKLNDQGEIFAADAIKKNQVSRTTSSSIGLIGGNVGMFFSIEHEDKLIKYWSYALSLDQENIYLVFNDHFKNAADDEEELSKPMGNPKKSVPFLVTISKDGSFEKEAMVTSGDTETYTVPQVIYHINDGEFIIWGVWKKSNKFGRATIK